MKAIYDITNKRCKSKTAKIEHIKEKNGSLLTKENEIKTRWKDHFNEILNRPEPPVPAEISTNGVEVLPINTAHPTTNEIRSVIKELKSGKAPGYDNITGELIRVDFETSVKQIHNLLTKIWDEEAIPTDWKKGMIVILPKKGDLTSCGN